MTQNVSTLNFSKARQDVRVTFGHHSPGLGVSGGILDQKFLPQLYSIIPKFSNVTCQSIRKVIQGKSMGLAPVFTVCTHNLYDQNI